MNVLKFLGFQSLPCVLSLIGFSASTFPTLRSCMSLSDSSPFPSIFTDLVWLLDFCCAFTAVSSHTSYLFNDVSFFLF